jgi:hypothetical protein
VGLVDASDPDAPASDRLWSAQIVLPSGQIHVGVPGYLDTDIRMTCTDSVPFVTLFSARKALPVWAQRVLSLPDVSGEAHLALGRDTLAIAPCRIRSGSYQVDLRFVRDPEGRHGELLARAGPLSLGIGIRPTGPELHPFGAQRWFDARGLRTPG